MSGRSLLSIMNTASMQLTRGMEMNEKSVTVRRYGSREETRMSLDAFIDAMLKEIEQRK